jgi:hypothetical protein
MTKNNAPPGNPTPVLLNFREVLFGKGILLEVCAVNGRALCVQEPCGAWIYGVNPSGMPAFGVDPAAAGGEFRQHLSGILGELAADATNLEEFSSLVREFFASTDATYEHEWLDAVTAVRRRSSRVPGHETASPADFPLQVTVNVKELAQLRPADNLPQLQLDVAC